MSNVVTRIVLFEKELCFFKYNNPHKVPLYLWESISNEISFIESITEKIEFISKNILTSILKLDNFYVCPTMYNPYDFMPLKRIIFGNKLSFQISYSGLDNNIVPFKKIDGLTLKKIICKSWDEKRDYRNL